MKKVFYFMSLVAMVAAMAACNSKDPNEGNTPEDVVEPAKITIAEAFQEFYMNKGETIKITYTVAPSGINVDYTLNWESDDPDVAIVVNDEVQAVGLGTAEISVNIPEYPDVKKAKFTVTVLNPIKVGDFLYKDGSWGESTIDKDIIGMVYWLGNPTLFDPILEVDFPNCTHGLAMSLKQTGVGQWQKDFQDRFIGDYGDDPKALFTGNFKNSWCDGTTTMTEWGVKNSNYSDLLMPYLENEDLRAADGKFCGIGGYTITALMKQYMTEDPDAAKYPLEIYQNFSTLVESLESPLTTSGWYMPSLFEAGLMVNTALTKPMDFDKPDSVFTHNHDNVAVLNNKLSKLPGTDQLPTTDAQMASVTDAYMPLEGVMSTLGCYETLQMMVACNVTIKEQADIDKMTPEEKEKYEADLQKSNDNYKAWMETAGIEWQDSYATEGLYQRIERFLKSKNIEYSEKTLGNIGIETMLSLFIAEITGPIFANVDVETGKSKFTNPMFPPSDGINRGCKGLDNSKDYLRAIIAF